MLEIIEDKNADYSNLLCKDSDSADVYFAVKEIIDNVKNNGDSSLIDYTKKFDGVTIESLSVSQAEIDKAYSQVDEDFLDVLKKSAKNIERFHTMQKRSGFKLEDDGTMVGQKIVPIENVGLYVPGGTAAYPSTVLMDCIPAKIAGCKNIVMVTPPNADGNVNPHILAAAKIAGVDKIFKVGGAQAIAALAFGTQSIPKVDKIVGPGNIFVAEAKRQVFGQVSIDMIAGPSEVLVIADEKSSAKNVAADLLSQAEHDRNASAILITTSVDFANDVKNQIELQVEKLDRKEIAKASIENNGKIIIANTVERAIDISNEIAPEHLELCVDNAIDYLDAVKNAGSVFLGRYCPEALGDYFAGPNHTLPTSGTARFSNPLSVDDFIKKTQFTYYSKDAFRNVAKDVAFFADKEGLTGHAASALSRLDD